jgi:hypothetical protein
VDKVTKMEKFLEKQDVKDKAFLAEVIDGKTREQATLDLINLAHAIIKKDVRPV